MITKAQKWGSGAYCLLEPFASRTHRTYLQETLGSGGVMFVRHLLDKRLNLKVPRLR